MELTQAEWSALRLSVQAAATSVALSLPLALALAYLLARKRFPGKWLLETVANLPLILPPVVTGYALLLLFGRQGPVGGLLERTLGVRVAFTWFGAALAAAVVSFPLLLRASRIGFEGVNERLEAAARGLGAGPLRVFLTVTLPLAWRGVLAGMLLAFGRGLGEFGATIMLAGNIPGATRTIPLAIFTQTQRPGGMEAAGRLVIIAVILAACTLYLGGLLERRGRRAS